MRRKRPICLGSNAKPAHVAADLELPLNLRCDLPKRKIHLPIINVRR
jgi:hypothetical protein